MFFTLFSLAQIVLPIFVHTFTAKTLESSGKII